MNCRVDTEYPRGCYKTQLTIVSRYLGMISKYLDSSWLLCLDSTSVGWLQCMASCGRWSPLPDSLLATIDYWLLLHNISRILHGGPLCWWQVFRLCSTIIITNITKQWPETRPRLLHVYKLCPFTQFLEWIHVLCSIMYFTSDCSS